MPDFDDLLATFLDDSALPHERDSAVVALGDLGDGRAVDPLITALDDDPYDSAIARALGKLGDRRAVESLVSALEQSSGLNSGAAEALGMLADQRAAQPLIEALAEVPKPYSSDLTAPEAALVELGDLAVEPLLNALEDRSGSEQTRSDIVNVLGLIGNQRAVEPLITALGSDDSSMVRQQAAFALGAVGDARAIEPLVRALDDDQYVSYGATKALSELDALEQIDSVRSRLRSPKNRGGR